jgi:hypothetical protein
MSKVDPNPTRLPSNPEPAEGRKQVDIMIVGVQKAGTSTLLRYLGSHPQLLAQKVPEMTYFRDGSMEGELSDYWSRYFGDDEGIGRYVGKLAGLLYEPEGLERLHSHNPAVQAVVILRDPVRRAHSQFWYARLKGLEPLESFEEALDGDPDRFADARAAYRCRYLEAGVYAEPLEQLFDRFGRDQVHVYILEEYRNRAAESVAPLLRSIGLDAGELPEMAPTHNAARVPRSFRLAQAARLRKGPVQLVKRALPYEVKHAIRRRLLKANEVPWSPTPLKPETEQRLRAYFDEPNRRLESLLGRDLSSVWPGP